MTAEAQRLTIAQACGWTDIDAQGEYCFGTEPAKSELDARQFMMELPHYCSDLNAMHEAEKVLDARQLNCYENELAEVCNLKSASFMASAYRWHATASQRAEALLKALNIWSDA